jgi:hypothetical protein
MIVSDIKSVNTDGTWTNNQYQLNGVTFDLQTNANWNITGIKVNGTSSALTRLWIMTNENMVDYSSCILSMKNATANCSFIILQRVSPWTVYAMANSDSDVVIQNASDNAMFYIEILANKTVNTTLYPMIRYVGGSSDFEPFVAPTTHTTTYPSAIYRGSEDVVNGEVVTEWGMIDSYAGETLPGEWISDRDEYAPGTTPTMGAQVAYALATPTTSSVTPTNLPVKSLNGYTHIESSTGDLAVEYITQQQQPIVDLIESSSGTSGHNYSTTEQVVGTWIDGSTLYEKTIKKQNISSASSSTVLIPSSELTGMNIIEIDGSYVSRTSNSTYAINAYINSDTITATWLAEDNIYYWLYWGATDTYDAYITIRYTKTSTRSLSKGTTEAEKTSSEPISEPLETKTDNLSKDETELKEEDESKEIEEITDVPEVTEEEPVDPEPSKEEEADER